MQVNRGQCTSQTGTQTVARMVLTYFTLREKMRIAHDIAGDHSNKSWTIHVTDRHTNSSKDGLDTLYTKEKNEDRP